jgi:hypothetical protein
VLSACLTGRGRQLRTGHEQGFVTALIRAGAPGVIAAAYMVPDHLAAEFIALLYHFAQDATLADAVLLARQTLAEDGYHPAAWGCFVQHGAVDVHLSRPHETEPGTWEECATRYLASGSDKHLRSARELLFLDQEIPTSVAKQIDDDLSALAERDAGYFAARGAARAGNLPENPQAAIIAFLLPAYGLLRYATADPAEQESRARILIAEALSAGRILGDSYLLIAAAVELRKYLLPFGDNETVLIAARNRLRWLTADEEDLDEARRAVLGEAAHV